MPDTQRQMVSSPATNSDAFPLFHLGYVSSETQDFSPDALIALLTEAREANAKRAVTGLLLYREGSFYQVLEGAEADVMSTFNGIERDPRHVRSACFSKERPAPANSRIGKWAS